MTEYSQTYLTHKFVIKKENNWNEIYIILDDNIYCEIVRLSYSIEIERLLIRNFFLSIFPAGSIGIFLFKDDENYKNFCRLNGINYFEQKWFKVAYIKQPTSELLLLLRRISIEFQYKFFPKPDPLSNHNKIDSLDDYSKEIKEDFKIFKQEIKKINILKLYHFTDTSNLQSIVKYGKLFSAKYLKENNLKVEKYSSSEQSRNLDMRKNLDNFVRLSFSNIHPMMHVALQEQRISNPFILEIDPTVILLKNTIFSNMNAAANGAIVGGSIEHFLKIDFKIVLEQNYFGLSESQRSSYQAEILVKENISKEYILNYKSILELTNKNKVL